MPLELLFETSDTEIRTNNEETKNNKIVFIPDTCDPNMELFQDNDCIQIEEIVIKNTIDPNEENKKNTLTRLRLNDQSTPKSVKKLLNDHGLCDMTNSPTVIESNNKEFKKNKSGDKFDHLLDNIFSNKNDSSEKEKSIEKQKNVDDGDDSLDFSLDFKKETPQNHLKKTKLIDEHQNSPLNTKKRFRQITMTQAFDNFRTSQFKENQTTASSSNGCKIPMKASDKVLSENLDILKKKNIVKDDEDDDLFLIETNNENFKSLNSTKPKFDIDSNTNFEDDEDDDLIFNFDKPPKKKTTSPNYKHVQVIKKHDERKKLTANSCRECEQVKTFGLF
jgi:hypothetical protein